MWLSLLIWHKLHIGRYKNIFSFLSNKLFIHRQKCKYGDRLVNGRRLTNIGSFRAYIEAYLKSHPMIHDKDTFLVRQLAPSEMGLPIEIYVFTNITGWIADESIQSDIFDHLLAVLTEFGLQEFQNPTGKNFEQLKH